MLLKSFRITPRPPLFAFTIERPLFALREREPHEAPLFQFPPASRQVLQSATYIFLNRPQAVTVSTTQHAKDGSRPDRRGTHPQSNDRNSQCENENRTRHHRTKAHPQAGSKAYHTFDLVCRRPHN